MIIMITEYCEMECTHCCMNASKEGKHMTKETFMAALDFYDIFQFPHLIITGGEPTDHPLFEEFMDEVLRRNYILYILSNGLWSLDERKDIYLSKYKFQVTNDKRYYPIYVPEIDHPNVIYGGAYYPILKSTRSIKNNIYDTTQTPKCFNLRSTARTLHELDFPNIINLYTLKMLKMCLPIVKINGDMILGETDLCKPFGSIFDSMDVLKNKLINFKCNNCGYFDNLPTLYRAYIGENLY